MRNAYLSHVAYRVGTARPIETLVETESLAPEVVTAFRARGLRDYRVNEHTLADMCVASAAETLRLAGIGPDGVDTVLIAGSNADAVVDDDDEHAMFLAWETAGFVRARILGLTLQACSALGDALRVAAGLVGEEPDARPVLVVVYGQKQKTSRLGPQTNLVFSDGAASCLVSRNGGTYAIAASESMTNTRLAAMGRAGNIAQFQGGLVELREITRSVCDAAGVKVSDVRAFFGTNAGTGHLHLMAQAADVPIDRVYDEDVAAYSHVHSCDNLISLLHYAERHALIPDDTFLLLSWSPHVVSGAVLRYVG